MLAPSRELAEQIGSVGRAISKGTHIKVSDTSQSEKSILSATVICATPNKIISLLNEKKLSLKKCQIMVLDECDKMVEIGNKLNPDDVKYFISQVNIIKVQSRFVDYQFYIFKYTSFITLFRHNVRQNFKCASSRPP